MDVDEAKIKRDVWDPVVKTMPTQYAGTVRLDGKPLAGVRVTDGIHFVETDENGRYTHDKHIGSFVGFAPAYKPRLCVLVALREPSTGSYYGGTVSAPSVGRIIERSLAYLESTAQHTTIARASAQE